MTERVPSHIRLTTLSLPISGLLGVISVLQSGVFINPSTDPEAFARSADTIALGNLLGIVSLVFLLACESGLVLVHGLLDPQIG